MTTAYIVEVNLPEGKRYLGSKGMLRRVPKFFVQAAAIKHYFSHKYDGWGGRYGHYDRKVHAHLTGVIRIIDLEKGLRESKAEVLTWSQFMTMKSNRISIPNNPAAIYKIRLEDKSFVKYGRSCQKTGKTWNRAGDVRAHISLHISMLKKLPRGYDKAEVVEIEYDEGGIYSKNVKYYPLVDFYKASPDCKRKFDGLPTKTVS